MYKRESGGWLKHYDFLLLDMICLQIAFLLSFVVLGRGFNPYSHILYRKMALYLELADVVVVFFCCSALLCRYQAKKAFCTAFSTAARPAVKFTPPCK